MLPRSAEVDKVLTPPNPRKLSMPAVLSDVAPNEKLIFVPRLLGQRPELAALVAETISTWSYQSMLLQGQSPPCRGA